MPVHNASEYEMELMGVVPKVDLMENATPKDIINRPSTKKQILLIINNFISVKIFKIILQIDVNIDM